jgi:hypothetical protein
MNTDVWQALAARPWTLVWHASRVWLAYQAIALACLALGFRGAIAPDVLHGVGLALLPGAVVPLSALMLRGAPPRVWLAAAWMMWPPGAWGLAVEATRPWSVALALLAGGLSLRPILLSALTGRTHWFRFRPLPPELWQPRPLPDDLASAPGRHPSPVAEQDPQALRVLGLRPGASVEAIAEAESRCRREMAARRQQLGRRAYQRELLAIGQAADRLRPEPAREGMQARAPDAWDAWEHACRSGASREERERGACLVLYREPCRLREVADHHPVVLRIVLSQRAPDLVPLFFPTPILTRVSGILARGDNPVITSGAVTGGLIGLMFADAWGIRTACVPFYENVLVPLGSIGMFALVLLAFVQGIGCVIFLGLTVLVWLAQGCWWVFSSLGLPFGAAAFTGVVGYALLGGGLAWGIIQARRALETGA